jgi:hypothetical protein
MTSYAAFPESQLLELIEKGSIVNTLRPKAQPLGLQKPSTTRDI